MEWSIKNLEMDLRTCLGLVSLALRVGLGLACLDVGPICDLAWSHLCTLCFVQY